MQSNNKKKSDDKYLKILREMVSHEGNRYCFDCNQRGPTYVNMTIGSFVCTNCGGALRKYSHRVKSISMSNFTAAEMDLLKKRGNEMCRRIYMGLCDRSFTDIKTDKVDDILRQKYDNKKWYLEPTREQEEETERANQEIFDRVEKTGVRAHQRPSVNAAAGLIVQPPKSSSSVAISRTPHLNTAPVTSNGELPRKMSLDQPLPAVPSAAPKASVDLFSDFGNDPFALPTGNGNMPVSSVSSSGPSCPGASVQVLPAFVASGNLLPSTTGPNTSRSQPPAPTPPTASFGMDKYAALAELDGLFHAPAPPAATSTMYGSPPRGHSGSFGSSSGGGIPSSASASAGWPIATGNSWVSPGGGGQMPWQQQQQTQQHNAMPPSKSHWANPFAGNSPAESGGVQANPFSAGSPVANPFGGVSVSQSSWPSGGTNTVSTNGGDTSGWSAFSSASTSLGQQQNGGVPSNFGGGLQGNPFMNISNPPSYQSATSHTNPFL